MPLRWEQVAGVDAADFTLGTVPAIYARDGDAHAGIDDAVGSLDALLELSARHEAEGMADAPWPPNYRKQESEPPRVQPSRQRRPAEDYNTPEAEAEREKARAAMEKRFERMAAERGSGYGRAALAHRQAGFDEAAGRNRTSWQEGRGSCRARALEGTAHRYRRVPPARRRADGFDARAEHDLDTYPRQP